jgi:hypothetical protein
MQLTAHVHNPPVAFSTPAPEIHSTLRSFFSRLTLGLLRVRRERWGRGEGAGSGTAEADHRQACARLLRRHTTDAVVLEIGGHSNVEPPDDAYDAIIVPERVESQSGPAAILRRYARCLKPAGVFIVTTVEKASQAAGWDEIHAIAYPIDSCVTKNAGGTWITEALRMRRTVWHTCADDGSF